MQLTTEQVSTRLESLAPGATVYLVGAGGCGMSGLGHLLLDLGLRVAGSDLVMNEEARELAARGARLREGHDAAHLVESRPALVVYSSAIRAGNPEMAEAERLGIPIARRAVALAAIARRQRAICVAGMHGKTTTASLLAFALENLRANPSYAVGALVPQLRRHARLSLECADLSALSAPGDSSPGKGASSARVPEREASLSEPDGDKSPPHSGDESPHSRNYFVVETDESDGTLCEFHPQHAIVLNVDEEHLDYYADIEAVGREFSNFARQVSGMLLFCADDPRLAELFARLPQAVSYGFHPLAAYRLVRCEVRSERGEDSAARTSRFSPLTSFEVWHSGQKLGDYAIRLTGEKNISNAGAVVALLHRLGYAPENIARAIAGFRGAARRQEEVFADARFRVFDDYGHHPAEIEATLRALKESSPRRLLVAFQPHRFTRTQRLLDRFATSFRDADLLWITEVYAASEAEIPGVNGARLAEAIRATGQAAEFVPSVAGLPVSVRAAMLPGDAVLFLGAGDITVAVRELAARLRTESMLPGDELFARLTAALSAASLVRRDEPLAKRTTLRVGGKADYYVEPASEEDLSRLLRFCAEHHLAFTLIGRGSNLLIRDGGIRGVVICLAHENFSKLEIQGARMRCGAGVRLKTVSVEARRAGLAGLEFLEGIPGNLGGAMRMNAGAMGSWLFDAVETIRFMDYAGRVEERAAGEINVEYRGCPLFKDHVALGAVLKGQPATPEAVAERMAGFSARRWETQPAAPSAGCIFKNPAGIPAGKLIDDLGLKGARVGGAVVSDVHGNFIVNDGSATASDVLNLIDVVKQRAKSARGIELQTEVEILGEG